MNIAIIGAGNGGQALAAYLSMQGHHIFLYDKDVDKIKELAQLKSITLEGKICGSARIHCITDNIATSVSNCELILVTTVANAHAFVAKEVAPFLKDEQVIILNPGRTCGALVFKQALKAAGCNKKIYIAEAQTLIFACRIIENGRVNVIGVKDNVLLAALPAKNTHYVLDFVSHIFPCFTPAPNVLATSLENIGAIFHPCVLLFNAATIERQTDFYFYRDMTPRIAAFIEQFDAERLAVGQKYGYKLLGVSEWISYAYQGTKGETLCEKMQNNPAYYDIKSPSSIYTRQLTEDIPTGVIPIMELGKAAGIETPLLQSMVTMVEALLGQDLRSNGRTLTNLGLEKMTKDEIIDYVSNEA